MLSVSSLTIRFPDHPTPVVHDVTFTLDSGEILGLVGESGSGKTLTALAAAGLIHHRHAVVSGQVLQNGHNLLDTKPGALRHVLGTEIGMVFQEPQSSFNPLIPIGKQIAEVLRLHTPLSPAERKAHVLSALTDVGIEHPLRVWGQYPHELSGGMRQRAMLAAATLQNPRLLICDEPTTALDVTTSGQIIQLLRQLNETHGTAILFITHDLRLVERLCHRVMIMQAGKIVEQGDVSAVFSNPSHDYTRSLLRSRVRKRGDQV